MSRRYKATALCPDCGHEVRATLDGEIGSHACRHRQAVARFGVTVTCNETHPLNDVHWKDASWEGHERWRLTCCGRSLVFSVERLDAILQPIRAAGLDHIPIQLLDKANSRVKL